MNQICPDKALGVLSTEDYEEFTRKVAVVTGGNSGNRIGQRAAVKEEGAKVAIHREQPEDA